MADIAGDWTFARECPAYHTVDITEVPDFNKMYELYDNTTLMFFFR